MNNNIAVNLLGILGNDIRLIIFRMLIQAGKKGLKPRQISSELEIKPNKLSFHLNKLKTCDLIFSKKDGREITYSANYILSQELIEFLFDNCCKDDSERNCIDLNKNNKNIA
jgi:ArsR family transcriptional regulator, arsenate/arsenite/antimonite-responsive transcriptional repressor